MQTVKSTYISPKGRVRRDRALTFEQWLEIVNRLRRGRKLAGPAWDYWSSGYSPEDAVAGR
jgi:hypothetical protein